MTFNWLIYILFMFLASISQYVATSYHSPAPFIPSNTLHLKFFSSIAFYMSLSVPISTTPFIIITSLLFLPLSCISFLMLNLPHMSAHMSNKIDLYTPLLCIHALTLRIMLSWLQVWEITIVSFFVSVYRILFTKTQMSHYDVMLLGRLDLYKINYTPKNCLLSSSLMCHFHF